MQNREIPVLLLTGYLGSGKTTLLNRILNNRKGIRFAVIVNDIGEVNIDADLIQKGGVVGSTDDSLVPLQNGCICCTLKMDLVNQLNDLCRADRFDYIVIEASGICEPAPIAQTICGAPSMLPEYARGNTPKLDCIVTVVDALRMQSEFDCGEALRKDEIGEEDIENLVIQQIEFCNIVLLNKVSEVTPAELGRVKAIVAALNPKAEIIECDWCDVDFDRILGTGKFDFDKVATSAAWIAAIEGDLEADGDDDADHDDEDHDGHGHHEEHHGHDDYDHHGHHHHHHHEGGEVEEYNIGTYVYFRRPALDINRFDNFVAKHWPKNIIRAKGICYFADEKDKCYLFEQSGVQKSIRNAGLWFATMPEEQLEEMMERDANLRRDWDPDYGDRMVKIVFIGQNLDRKELAAMMDECLEKQ
ncbi:MAG: GTP-binding protein [Bacteroidales bacterium]|uniref:GTP-binding protein n=1 Tax=Candidatus Cryptobacteroides sp. TaxID=2952915 RepID=UPI002A7F4729|nr:GTP-binding protein [Candidatus Cryptobacteroides sp.]MDD7136289.1 GTP-binding protein [Bacteroidales bacterium]MDY3879077.1 GTP-binding protein [Candidatus Cryptobacteroides sp.]MDY5566808.1 GTP-binding protein [Candidatus Cryptobacteroides sp.]